MWLGLYLIAFSLLFTAMFVLELSERKNKKNNFVDLISSYFFLIGLASIPIITIAFGINLIING